MYPHSKTMYTELVVYWFELDALVKKKLIKTFSGTKPSKRVKHACLDTYRVTSPLENIPLCTFSIVIDFKNKQHGRLPKISPYF